MRITRRDQIGLKERRKAANARGCRAKGNKRGGKKLRKGKSKKWARAKSLLTGKAARRGRKPVETDADGDVAGLPVRLLLLGQTPRCQLHCAGERVLGRASSCKRIWDVKACRDMFLQ